MWWNRVTAPTTLRGLSTNTKYSVPKENSMMLESDKCARKFKYEVENKHCRKVESLHTCFLCKLHFGHTFFFYFRLKTYLYDIISIGVWIPLLPRNWNEMFLNNTPNANLQCFILYWKVVLYDIVLKRFKS